MAGRITGKGDTWDAVGVVFPGSQGRNGGSRCAYHPGDEKGRKGVFVSSSTHPIPLPVPFLTLLLFVHLLSLSSDLLTPSSPSLL